MKQFSYLLLFFVVFTGCKPKLQDAIYAEIDTNKGLIFLELFYKEVPMTVANFVSLAEGTNLKVLDSLKGKRFYDGLKFHRVVPNYVIQGGDPTGTGNGSAGYIFPNEIPMEENGNVTFKHKKGALSMANYGPHTNSNQFFITHRTISKLDGSYTVFGQVLEGQEIVDKIQEGDFINKMTIKRIGKTAKNYNAFDVFERTLIEENQKLEDVKAAKKMLFQQEKGIENATKTNSSLQILELKKGTGKKFNRAVECSIKFSVFLATGELIQSTTEEKPFTFILSKTPMIAGVSEAILTMKEGDKKRLFIPYYLGYGEQSFGPFPSKSDLIFDLELIKVGK